MPDSGELQNKSNKDLKIEIKHSPEDALRNFKTMAPTLDAEFSPFIILKLGTQCLIHLSMGSLCPELGAFSRRSRVVRTRLLWSLLLGEIQMLTPTVGPGIRWQTNKPLISPSIILPKPTHKAPSMLNISAQQMQKPRRLPRKHLPSTLLVSSPILQRRE